MFSHTVPHLFLRIHSSQPTSMKMSTLGLVEDFRCLIAQLSRHLQLEPAHNTLPYGGTELAFNV